MVHPVKRNYISGMLILYNASIRGHMVIFRGRKERESHPQDDIPTP